MLSRLNPLAYVGTLFILLIMTNCSLGTSKNESSAENQYQCPMKCEGEKTYSKSGYCPICKMEITELKTQ